MALLQTDFLQGGAYSAKAMRNATLLAPINGEGVATAGAFAVSQRAAGANMSVDIAPGDAYVRGDHVALQGLYHQTNDAAVNLPVSAAHATLPRIDLVILQIADAAVFGVSNLPTLQVLPGTPTAGATLDNLTGAASLPLSAMPLAYILVPAASSTVTNANISSERPSQSASAGPTRRGSNISYALPLDPIQTTTTFSSVTNGYQYWGAVIFSSPVVGANRLRFALHQSSVPTGTVNVGIYGSGGRKITETGAVTLSGTGSPLIYSATIPALNLDGGIYYVAMGFTVSANAPAPVKYDGGFGAVFDSFLGGYAISGGATLPTRLPSSPANHVSRFFPIALEVV